MYQEKETKYDAFAKKLFYDFRKTKKGKGIPHWERLYFKDREEWRGIAQLIKRERRHAKKLRKKTGDKNERPITRSG